MIPNKQVSGANLADSALKLILSFPSTYRGRPAPAIFILEPKVSPSVKVILSIYSRPKFLHLWVSFKILQLQFSYTWISINF